MTTKLSQEQIDTVAAALRLAVEAWDTRRPEDELHDDAKALAALFEHANFVEVTN